MRTGLASGLLLLAAGCTSSSASIPQWQQSVSRHVREEAHGDPMILRDVTLPDSRPGFALIGHHDAGLSTDANGVLLGHEQVGGQTWFVYLVGLVEKQSVSDIRLAALAAEGGKTKWKRGPASKQSLQAYRAHGLTQARERFPDRRKPPPRYTGFPRPDDVFKLTNESGKLTATHEASGARWELVLAGK